MFQFQLVSKIYYQYLKILFIYKWYQLLFCQLQFDFIGIKICFVDLRNFKICFKVISKFVDIFAYMQGELNIVSIYRFMLSVSHFEELDISSLCDTCVQGSLCDTRVQGELNISTYALYILLYVSQSFVIPSSCNACMQGS